MAMPKIKFDKDGYPMNLEAAALDALEWLRAFEAQMIRRHDCHSDESRERIGRAIAALEKYLPEENHD